LRSWPRSSIGSVFASSGSGRLRERPRSSFATSTSLQLALLRELEQAGAESVTLVLVGERGTDAVRALAGAVL